MTKLFVCVFVCVTLQLEHTGLGLGCLHRQEGGEARHVHSHVKRTFAGQPDRCAHGEQGVDVKSGGAPERAPSWLAPFVP